MVNANGDPTRTRDRKVGIVRRTDGTLKLDAAHRFARQQSNLDAIQREQLITSIGARVDALSPATQRVLRATEAAMLISFDLVNGYGYRQYVNRAAIARVLKRQALVPYDIRMLHQLCDQRLIEEFKHPLPRQRYGDIWLGAGAEFVYTIPDDVLYCLLYHDPKERARLDALGARYRASPTSAPAPPNRPHSAPIPTTPPTPPAHRKLTFSRLLDLVSDQNLKKLLRL